MNRTKKILDLRPLITIESTLESKPEEQFQNITLRGILKFQNEILITWFQDFVQSKKIDLKEEATIILGKALSKNGQSRQELIGMIIGHFTLDEFMIYKNKSKEYGKRIVQMAIERFLSQLKV